MGNIRSNWFRILQQYCCPKDFLRPPQLVSCFYYSPALHSASQVGKMSSRTLNFFKIQFTPQVSFLYSMCFCICCWCLSVVLGFSDAPPSFMAPKTEAEAVELETKHVYEVCSYCVRICLSVCLSVCLSAWMSVHQSVSSLLVFLLHTKGESLSLAVSCESSTTAECTKLGTENP